MRDFCSCSLWVGMKVKSFYGIVGMEDPQMVQLLRNLQFNLKHGKELFASELLPDSKARSQSRLKISLSRQTMKFLRTALSSKKAVYLLTC
jgi:hypothetical protein